jgi:hypothetical protein
MEERIAAVQGMSSLSVSHLLQNYKGVPVTSLVNLNVQLAWKKISAGGLGFVMVFTQSQI